MNEQGEPVIDLAGVHRLPQVREGLPGRGAWKWCFPEGGSTAEDDVALAAAAAATAVAEAGPRPSRPQSRKAFGCSSSRTQGEAHPVSWELLGVGRNAGQRPGRRTVRPSSWATA